MDRKIVYAGQVPLSSQALQSERNHMVGIGHIAQAVFGTGTVADGLDCVPTVPASLAINITPGSLYNLASLDGSAFGSLVADISHNIVKQGIILDTTELTLVPPETAGYAVNYLVQAAISEVDTDSAVLPYVNSANPLQPFTGPNNSGTSQPTTRKCTVVISAKAGVAATAGTQTTPAPDAGYVGLYAITVAQGATQLTSNEIVELATAPFLFKKLPELPRWVQSGAFLWGDDTGTKNAIKATLAPLPTQYTKGMHVFIKKMNAANDGNVTVNLMGIDGEYLGAVALLDATGAQIGEGNLPANCYLHAVFNGTAFIHVNGAITNTSISSITASSGEGIIVGGEDPWPVSLNFPGLTEGEPTALDLFAFYDNEGAAHKQINYAALLALISGSLVTGLVNVQVITASGTYTKTAGAKKALVFATAGGGGGGGASTTGGGGGAGETALALVNLAAISTVACVIGAGGAGGVNGAGTNGGDTSFGAYAVGKGGKRGHPRTDNYTYGSPGGGGYGGTGLLLMGGGAGGPGGPVDGGPGGNSFWGGGGRGAGNPDGAAGPGAGLAPGAGGGGGDGGSGGADGAAGVIFVLEFA